MPAISDNNKIFEPEIILKDISVKNFRGFEDIKISLDPKLNVIIGENGSGKTALLECIEKILYIFIQNMQREKIPLKQIFNKFDIKYETRKTSLNANFLSDKNQVRFTIFFEKENFESPNIKPYGTKPLQTSLYGKDNFKKPVNLPVFTYYPAVNAPLDFTDFKNIQSESAVQDIFSTYDGILKNNCFDFKSFFAWYRWQENIEKQIGENKILTSVKNSIYSVLSENSTEFDKLSVNWLNDPNGEMLINKNGIPLNINQLSSGEKFILVLVSDIARRLVIANPHRENPLDGYGIILIDEVDLHLHPGWQRIIIPQLQKTFPNCQFIVTTHSPLVLSRIKPHHIIMLQNFKQIEKTPYTFGRDANSILYELMGVANRPEEIQKLIDNVYELIDEQELTEAKKLLDNLFSKKTFCE